MDWDRDRPINNEDSTRMPPEIVQSQGTDQVCGVGTLQAEAQWTMAVV